MNTGLAATAFVFALTALSPHAIAQADAGCGSGTSVGFNPGTVDIGQWVQCDKGKSAGVAGSAHAVVKTLDCGPRSTAGGFAAPTGQNCTQSLRQCALAPGKKAAPNTTVEITLTQQPDGSWKVASSNCAAPVGRAQGVTGVDVRDAVRRLVPRPAVGVAPPGGVTLVNMQTVLWVDTPTTRSLGPVQLLGQSVAIEVHIDHVDWSFGDGAKDSTSSPGTPYHSTSPCRTAMCPGYYGHVYRATGAMRVTAQVTWTGRYRVGGGAWEPIPGTVTGTATATQLIVREARGVLVPDPSGR